MIRVWWPAFFAAGYTRADFASALPRLIAAAETPRWPREHLAAVKSELARCREERERRARPAQQAELRCCPVCDCSGCVEVPHPSCIDGGEWIPPYRTGAVFCDRCGLGRRAFAAALTLFHDGKIGRMPLRLTDYEYRYDAVWAEHMAQHKSAVKLMLQAEAVTESIEPSLLVRRLAAGMASPRKP